MDFLLYDINGNVIMDLDTQPSLVRGNFTVPKTMLTSVTGSDVHPSYANQRAFFGVSGGTFNPSIRATEYGSKEVWLNMFTVGVTISGQTLSWTVTNKYGMSASYDLFVVYGVY